MKRTFFFFISLAAMAGAGALLVLEQYEYAVYASFLAWFMSVGGVKFSTAPTDIFANISSSILLGVCLMPTSLIFPFLAVAGFLLSMCGVIRLIMFSQIGYLKARWIEPLCLLAGLGLYFYFNLQYPVGWMGWIFMGLVAFFAVFMTLGSIAGSQKMVGLTKNNEFKIGVGQPAPDFKLTDHNGEETTLSNFKEKSNVLLIFVRGDWCPSCHIMLRTYQRNKEKFAEKNVTIMAIGPDPVGINRQMVEEMGVQYKILSDEKLECSRIYGIALEPHGKPPKDTTTPLPASFLISADGILRYSSRADDPGQILNPSDIFPILSNLN